jgi:hypothetical protein
VRRLAVVAYIDGTDCIVPALDKASAMFFHMVDDLCIVAENNSPACPANGNPNPECTKPRTRVTNINEYYFCDVRAVHHQFYFIYCLFISYANVNNYVSLLFYDIRSMLIGLPHRGVYPI